MALSVLGTGSYLPTRIVDNDELSRLTGLQAPRIQELFDVRERRWVRGQDSPRPTVGQHCSDLAVEACRAALCGAGLSDNDVDTLIAVTVTPDCVNPSLDTLVCQKLGWTGKRAFTIQAPCTGAFRAMMLADALIAAGHSRCILIVASETSSPFFRFGPDVPQDHKLNSALYGDAAAALVVGPAEARNPRLDSFVFKAVASADRVGIAFPGRQSAIPPGAQLESDFEDLGYHEFRRVLRHGSRLAGQAAREVLTAAGLDASDVRWFLTHQATGNLRRIGESVGIPPEKMPLNIGHVGNTVSASVLLLFDELVRGGQVAVGDELVLHTAESSSWSYAGARVSWR